MRIVGMRNAESRRPSFIPHSAFWILTAAFCILPAACNPKTIEPIPRTAAAERAGRPAALRGRHRRLGHFLHLPQRRGNGRSCRRSSNRSAAASALIDYDGDGLLDVFITGGGGYAGPDDKDIVGLPCRLYRTSATANSRT